MTGRIGVPVVAAALAGLLVGLAVAVTVILTPGSYEAGARLAVVPAAAVPPEEIPSYWEILSRGQTTRTAAEVLGQSRWIDAATAEVGLDPASVEVSAGALTETTLIDLVVRAPAPEAAEQVAAAIVRLGTPVARDVVGPFEIRAVQEPEGSARDLSSPAGQVLAAFGTAGLLAGVGCGLLAERLRRRRDTSGQPPAERGGDDPAAYLGYRSDQFDGPTQVLRNGASAPDGRAVRGGP